MQWVLGGTSVADLLMSHAACFYLITNYWIYFKIFIVNGKIEKSISPELERFMNQNGFSNLDDLFAIEDEDLLQIPGFGWRMMKEVLLLREVQ